MNFSGNTHRVPITTWEMSVDVVRVRILTIVDFRHLEDISCRVGTYLTNFSLTENALVKLGW